MFYSRPIKIDRENSLRGCCYMKVIGWGHYGGCTGTQDIEVWGLRSSTATYIGTVTTCVTGYNICSSVQSVQWTVPSTRCTGCTNKLLIIWVLHNTLNTSQLLCYPRLGVWCDSSEAQHRVNSPSWRWLWIIFRFLINCFVKFWGWWSVRPGGKLVTLGV